MRNTRYEIFYWGEMMEQYIWAGVYVVLGLFAACYHWFEKRYIHKTTECNLVQYIVLHPSSSYKAGSAIFASEVALSMTHTGGFLSLVELTAILGLGYGFDNALNKAIDEEAKRV